MTKLNMFLVIIWAMSLCGIVFAQERGAASAIAWSPDGETIAVASTTGLWFFDNKFKEVGYVEIGHSDHEMTRYVEWNAAGDLIAVSPLWFGPIRIVNFSKQKVINEISFSMLKTPVLWHPTKNHIIGGSEFGETRILDAVTGKELFYLDNREVPPDIDVEWYGVLGLCWNNEKSVVIVNQVVSYIVDIAENSIPKRFVEYLGYYGAVCNREYQIITRDGRLYDLQTGTLTRIFDEDIDSKNHEFPVAAVALAWSPVSTRFVASLTGCLTRVYNSQNGALLAELPGGVRALPGNLWYFRDSIAWHPDGSRFAVVDEFGDIRMWDAETFELLQRFDGFELHPDLLRHLDDPEQLSELKCP